MNIWVEFWNTNDGDDNAHYHAQMKEHIKWIPPERSRIQRRYFATRQEAEVFAKSLMEQGYHTTINTDKGR